MTKGRMKPEEQLGMLLEGDLIISIPLCLVEFNEAQNGLCDLVA